MNDAVRSVAAALSSAVRPPSRVASTEGAAPLGAAPSVVPGQGALIPPVPAAAMPPAR